MGISKRCLACGVAVVGLGLLALILVPLFQSPVLTEVDYQVYSALLAQYVPEPEPEMEGQDEVSQLEVWSWSIAERTVGLQEQLLLYQSPQFKPSDSPPLKGLERATWMGFIRRREGASIDTNRIRSPKRRPMADPGEADLHFQVTRIGYNHTRDQALVHLSWSGEQMAGLGGSGGGDWCLLVLKQGRWHLVATCQTWIA